MPVIQIANPGAAFGNTFTTGVQVVADMRNNSGSTRTYGDVVVTAAGGGDATTTTTANDKTVVGVVGQQTQGQLGATAGDGSTYAATAVMPVVFYGVARVNIGANTIAAGDILAASTGAGAAVTNNSATVGQAIGIALEASGAKDSANTIRAFISKM